MLEITLLTDDDSPAVTVNTEYRNIDRVFDPADAMIVKDLARYLTTKSSEACCRVNGVDYYVRES